MKPHSSISRGQAPAGYLLIECLVYMSVIVVVIGLGFGAFYVCWDRSKALYYATDDINAALHAGERWRADIRSATGKIAVEATAEGERLRIPRGTGEIIYELPCRRSPPPDCGIGFFRIVAAQGQGIANDNGSPRAGCRLALGGGIDAAPQGNPPAFGVHL